MAADGTRARRRLTRIAHRVSSDAIGAHEKKFPNPLNQATTLVIVAEVCAPYRGAHNSPERRGVDRMPAKKKKKAAKKAPAKKTAAKKKGGAKKKKR